MHPLLMILCVFVGLAAYGQDVHAEEPKRGGNRVIWESMSPEQKSRVIEKYRDWKSLPPERRERVRRNYRNFNELSPQERLLIRERYRMYRELGPAGRTKVQERINRVETLPPDVRARVGRKARELRESSDEARMQRMRQSIFWKSLTKEEQDIFEKLIVTRD